MEKAERACTQAQSFEIQFQKYLDVISEDSLLSTIPLFCDTPLAETFG